MKNLHKQLFILCLFISSLPLLGTIFLSSAHKNTIPDLSKTDPAKILIAFDGHRVLVQKNIWSMSKNLFFNSFAFWRFKLKDVQEYIASIKEDFPEWQDQFIQAAEKFPELKPYIVGIFEIDNARTATPGMQQLLTNLSGNNYQLYVFSNMHHLSYYGWQGFVDEQGTLGRCYGISELMPELFSHFKDAQVYQIGRPRKDTPEAYQEFIQTFKKNATFTVLIDDKDKNAENAVKNGFDAAIKFESIAQLKEDLARLGIIAKLTNASSIIRVTKKPLSFRSS